MLTVDSEELPGSMVAGDRRQLVKARHRFTARILGTVAALVIVALLALPVLAQAPAPTVTFSGTFDQITSAGRNFYDGNYTRDNDREWYARTRFRPDFIFEVGRTRAVLGLEIDLNYGQTGSKDGGFPGNNSGTACGFVGGCKNAGSAGGGLDLNTDVAGLFEVKWAYTEFDLTGKNSLLPFIPFMTVARVGAQPFANIATHKVYYASGDFAGLSLDTTFTSELRNNLAFVIVEDQLAGGNRSIATARTSRGEDYAFILSPEINLMKGLDLKPLYSWFHADGVTSFTARRNATNVRTVSAGGADSGGMNSAGAQGGGNAAGDSTSHEDRHTIGLDARWRVGSFGLDPTIAYQTGTYDTQAQRSNGQIARVKGEMAAWLFDILGSYQLGPLLLEARGLYSTGNKARDNLSLSKHYFEPLDTDTLFWIGWGSFFALGAVDYFNGGAGANRGMSTQVGYDRYGRAQLGLRVTHSITPALKVYGVVTPAWTAEKVDTGAGCPALSAATSILGCPALVTVNDKSWDKGESSYLGTDLTFGTTWRFAANAALDMNVAYLFAGPALSLTELQNGVAVKKDARDAYVGALRVRFSY